MQKRVDLYVLSSLTINYPMAKEREVKLDQKMTMAGLMDILELLMDASPNATSFNASIARVTHTYEEETDRSTVQ